MEFDSKKKNSRVIMIESIPIFFCFSVHYLINSIYKIVLIGQQGEVLETNPLRGINKISGCH